MFGSVQEWPDSSIAARDAVQIFPRGIHAGATSLAPCHPGGTTSGALFLHGGAPDR